MSSFDGGTSVTQYGDQSARHAGDTKAIGVVTFTAAHGLPDAVDATLGDALGCGGATLAGAIAPHAVQASSQEQIIADFARPLTTSPETLAVQRGHPATQCRLHLRPFPRGTPAWQFAMAVS